MWKVWSFSEEGTVEIGGRNRGLRMTALQMLCSTRLHGKHEFHVSVASGAQIWRPH